MKLGTDKGVCDMQVKETVKRHADQISEKSIISVMLSTMIDMAETDEQHTSKHEMKYEQVTSSKQL